MTRFRHLWSPHLLTAGLFALVVVTIYFVQLREARLSASRTVGFYHSQVAAGLRIDEVVPGEPAALAGLVQSDLIVAIDGISIHQAEDYERAASRFGDQDTFTFQVRRDGRTLDLPVHPGVPVAWGLPLINGFVMLCCLTLGLLTMGQQAQGQRVHLLWILLFLMAFEMALPLNPIGNVTLSLVIWSAYYLITGAQIGVEVHLASSIPERPAWLRRHRWILGLYYLLGLGLGSAACAGALTENALGRQILPWSEEQAGAWLDEIGLPLWAGAVVVLLSIQARRHPERRGRMQALFVLLGVLPWASYVGCLSVLNLLDHPVPLWVDSVFPLLVLAYPVAVFLAIYRHHLFNIEGLVRQGLLYTALTSSLVLVFYAALGAGGALFSQLVGSQRHSIWVISASTLILGVLFAPLRSWLQEQIDQALFPERQALRQRLIHLASELPRQGTIQRMGQHLVTRLCDIFAVRSAALLLAEPESDLLLIVAQTPRQTEDMSTATLLLSAHNPGIELLQERGEPVSAQRLLTESSDLAGKLKKLRAELLIPLLHEDRLVGVLSLGRPNGVATLHVEQLDLLTLLAHHVAISLENVRLFASATYEGLTGLLRREAILALLDKELTRARRYGRPLTIAFADLDHFKRVNDRYGHLAGDVLLKSVADELAGGLRSTDTIGRYGGEEFLLVFPETSLRGALTVAEKIRTDINEIQVAVAERSIIKTSISIGLASLENFPDASSCTVDDLINAADQALYRAKKAGRNRVEPPIEG